MKEIAELRWSEVMDYLAGVMVDYALYEFNDTALPKGPGELPIIHFEGEMEVIEEEIIGFIHSSLSDKGYTEDQIERIIDVS